MGMANEPELMTTREVAAYLRMPVSTVYHLANTGELPGFQVGRSWRFERTRIEQLRDGAAPRPRVLVVDDEPAVRAIIERVLTHAGCLTFGAANVDEGVEMARQEQYGLIFVDLMLGGRSGTELVEELYPEYSLSQMIIVTAHRDLIEASTLLELGPITVVQKPFRTAQLIECAERHLGRKLRRQ